MSGGRAVTPRCHDTSILACVLEARIGPLALKTFDPICYALMRSVARTVLPPSRRRRRYLVRPNLFLPVVAIAALAAHGCAAAGLTLFGVGAGIGAGTGTAYTLDGIAYRTFTAPLDSTRVATIASLKRMAMP